RERVRVRVRVRGGLASACSLRGTRARPDLMPGQVADAAQGALDRGCLAEVLHARRRGLEEDGQAVLSGGRVADELPVVRIELQLDAHRRATFGVDLPAEARERDGDGTFAYREPRPAVTGGDGPDPRRARQQPELLDQLAGGVSTGFQIRRQDVGRRFEDLLGARLVVLAHASPPGGNLPRSAGRSRNFSATQVSVIKG